MLAELLASPPGAYALAVVLGVGVGLVVGTRGTQAWVATVLITFVLIAVTWVTGTAYVAPLYVVISSIVAIFVTAHDLRDSPPVADEPWWRRVALVAMHEGAIRRAAAEKERTDAAIEIRH